MIKVDLTPFLARGFGEREDRFIANIPVEGIDKYHTYSQIRLAPETAEYLYGECTPLKIKYYNGSRPRMEKIVMELLQGAFESPRDRMMVLLEWTAKTVKHAKYISGEAPVNRGGTEEELLDSGWGWCNEKARIFVTLAQIAGFPARMCSVYHEDGIHGHMTAEVFIEGQWSFVDPTSATVIPKSDGSLASAKDLSWTADIRQRINEAYRRDISEIDNLHGSGRKGFATTWYSDSPYKMFHQIGISNYPVITFPNPEGVDKTVEREII